MPEISSRRVGPTAAEVAADPGLAQGEAVGANRAWALQRDHGYTAWNTNLNGNPATHERGYQASPQQFRREPMLMALPPVTEQGWYLPGKNAMAAEE